MDAIRDTCKKYHVKSLYLVGSATNESRFTEEMEEMEYEAYPSS